MRDFAIAESLCGPDGEKDLGGAAGRFERRHRFGMALPEVPPGVYRVAFWNTATGNVIGVETVTLTDESHGLLRVNLLPITSQLAVRALRVAGPPETDSTPASWSSVRRQSFWQSRVTASRRYV